MELNPHTLLALGQRIDAIGRLALKMWAFLLSRGSHCSTAGGPGKETHRVTEQSHAVECLEINKYNQKIGQKEMCKVLDALMRRRV